MAHPIYSFRYPKNKKQYFQIWDTLTGYPTTVPMDLVTFLQYKGLYNREFVGVLFSIFNRLVENGCSLPNVIFPNSDEFQDVFYVHSIAFLDEFESNDSIQRKSINEKLEQLFSMDVEFSQFYTQYNEIISKIEEHPPRTLNYYKTYSFTIDCLTKSGTLSYLIIKQIFNQYKFSNIFSKDSNDIYNFDFWFKSRLFFDYKEVMALLFSKLALNNLISLDAIPHLLRRESLIRDLFISFNLENLLPQTTIINDIKPKVFTVKAFDVYPFIKQYVNSAAFSQYGDKSLIGLPLMELSDAELTDKLGNLYLLPNNFINFEDNFGEKLLPMIYSSHFKIEKKYNLQVLAPFNIQQYHVFSKNGILLDDSGYYDFETYNESVFYFQDMSLNNWARISFNTVSKKYSIDKIIDQVDPVNIENIENALLKVLNNNHELNLDDIYKKKSLIVEEIKDMEPLKSVDYEDDLPF